MWRDRPADGVWFLLTAALGFDAFRDAERSRSVAGMLYLVLHGVTAVLFLMRRSPRLPSSNVTGKLVAAASMLSVYLYGFEPADQSGHRLGDLLVSAGAALCIAASLSLGRSFGVLPAIRGVRTGGLYRWIRHPIYLSYALMDVGILIIAPTLANAFVFTVALVLLVLRIGHEERLLAAVPEYRQYQERVRFRFIPYGY